jgi:nanoRNase/pAp phosphatase (c-di-AMP/oligoRNAs hydrolase)
VTANGNRSSRDTILAELREADKLVVVAHENPDGDAIGSLVAMRGILDEIGKD